MIWGRDFDTHDTGNFDAVFFLKRVCAILSDALLVLDLA